MTPERWRQIEDLYHAARDRGRAALADADPELRAEVERLLSQDGDGRILDKPASELLTDSTSTVFGPGSQLGPYRIESRLGAGGMGEVFRATDTRLHRTVAIKILPGDKSADADRKRRLLLEARAASALNHPHIVTLHDIANDDGVDYLIMEYVPGASLDQLIPTDKGLPVRDAVDYAIQIASALAAAHAAGIVHRDIKPANVIVTAEGQVKVLDFGIAKLAHREEQTGAASLTESGMVIGTPAYMSPEQARADKLDARADLFSLGAVLYEMLTGRRAFTKPFDWTTPPLEGLPRTLRPIIARLIERDQEVRYQHASELRADLLRSQLQMESERRTPGVQRRRWHAVASASLAFPAVLATGWFYLHRAPKLTEKDTIVLADFENRTGDPVFDGTLRQGLAVELEQSPFLSLIPEERVQHALGLMGRRADARLTFQIAQEICERTGSAAVLEGSIAPLGSQYVIGLHAKNCRSGDVIDDEQVQVTKKEDVLNAVGEIATRFRKRAGESLATIRQHDRPLAEATTPSLEALKAYSAGVKAVMSEDEATAVPLLKRAIEIDPSFAKANELLGRTYSDLGESVLAANSMKRAWELRDRASDAERYSIIVSYEVNVTGNLEKAQQTAELWAQTYPRDANAHAALSAFIYQPFGNFEKSAEEARIVVETLPEAFYGYVNLAGTYMLLGRLKDAKDTIRLAAARKVEHPFLAVERYQIGFIEGDQAAMEREAALSREKGALREWIASAESLTLAYSGHLQQARIASRHAADLAQHVGQRETAALFEVEEALREAFFGNATEAQRSITAALQFSKGRDVQYGAALALALSGQSLMAEKLADELEKRFPDDTEVRTTYVPEIRALLALNRNEPAKAVEALQVAVPYELGVPPTTGLAFFGALYPLYVRGEAWLAARDGVRAAAEFRRILDRRYVVVNDPIAALSHLQLGRALVLAGDENGAKRAYQDFLTLWKNAEGDIPILQRARAEYARLQ